MDFEHFPPVTEELIQALLEHFPPHPPRQHESFEDLRWRGGQQEIIQFLVAVKEAQEEEGLTSPTVTTR